MFKLNRIIGGLLFLFILSGPATAKLFNFKKKEKPVLPRVLVLGFKCDNAEISGLIIEGILANMTSKVESFGPGGYELLISSITMKKAGLPPPQSNFGLSYPEGVEPVIAFSSATFYTQLEKSQYYRTKVNLETGLDYVIVGEAIEKDLSDLEFGNLMTAETASLKMMDLQDGSFAVETSFKQGLFEIVSPDRIGKKLTARINKYLKTVRKAVKREEKALQKN